MVYVRGAASDYDESGLDVTSAGKPQRINCLKEVILSSGTINSPALLLASGIGPAAELEALGLTCKVDLPGVGKNLRDHFANIRGAEMLPGDEVQTDAQIVDYLRSEASTVYHPVGTCKMGVDNMAVVSPCSLKVYGFENLRVANASIMPTLIAGNTSAPSMMIRQRAAVIILSAPVSNT